MLSLSLTSIPKPAEIELSDWLVCFQSFGFVLSVSPENSETVIALFREREITAAIIGKVTDEPTVTLKNGLESKSFLISEKIRSQALSIGQKIDLEVR